MYQNMAYVYGITNSDMLFPVKFILPKKIIDILK